MKCRFLLPTVITLFTWATGASATDANDIQFAQNIGNPNPSQQIDVFYEEKEFIGRLKSAKLRAPHLWSLKRDGKTSYLFGTVHVGLSLQVFPNEVIELIKNSEQIITEMNMVDSNKQALGILNKPFREYIFEEARQIKRTFLDSSPTADEIEKHYGHTPTELSSLQAMGLTHHESTLIPRTQTINYFLIWPELGLLAQPLDYTIEALGKVNNIPHHTLDTENIRMRAEKYLNAPSLMSPEDTGETTTIIEFAAALVVSPVSALAIKNEYASLYLDYFKDPAESLKETRLTTEEDGDVIYRNFAWLTKLRNHLQVSNTFIAVGYKHLYGEEGLLHQLRLEGYEIQPVSFSQAKR